MKDKIKFLYDSNQYIECVKECFQQIATYPDDCYAYYISALCFLETKQIEKSLCFFSICLLKKPDFKIKSICEKTLKTYEGFVWKNK